MILFWALSVMLILIVGSGNYTGLPLLVLAWLIQIVAVLAQTPD